MDFRAMMGMAVGHSPVNCLELGSEPRRREHTPSLISVSPPGFEGRKRNYFPESDLTRH